MAKLAGLVPRGLVPRGVTACLACASLATTPGAAVAELTIEGTYQASLTAAAIGPDGSVYTCDRNGIVKRSPDLAVVYEVNLAHHESNNLSTFTCNAIAVAPDGSVVAVGSGIRTTVIRQRNAIKATPEAYDSCGLTQLCSDGIVFRLDPQGALVLGAYVGVDGAIDELTDVAVLPDGDAVVGGRTFSAAFPTSTGVLGETSKALPSPGIADGVLLRFSARGKLKWSTFVGGPVGGVAAHPSGDIIMSLAARWDAVSWTVSAAGRASYETGHLARITGDGAFVSWATLLADTIAVDVGPVAVDGFGNIYAAETSFRTEVMLYSGSGSLIWATPMPGGDESRVTRMALRPDTGELLVTGWSQARNLTVNSPAVPLPRAGLVRRTTVAVLSAGGRVREATVVPRTRLNSGLPGGGIEDFGVAIASWTTGHILVASTHYNQEGRLISIPVAAGGAPPALAVAPASADAAGGSVVQVSGGPFDADAFVYVGDAPSPRVTRVHAGLLEVVVPAGTGATPITVINGNGGRATLANAITYSGQACTPALGDDQWRVVREGATLDLSSIGCLGTAPWSTAPWLTVTLQANSALRLQAAPNDGAERVAFAWHGTRVIRVAQGPAACGLDILPPALEVGPEAATVPVAINPIGNCFTNTTGQRPAWLVWYDSGGGAYNADERDTHRVVFEANTTGVDRVATVTVNSWPRGLWDAGMITRQLTVTQRATAACTPGVPTTLAAPADGGNVALPVSAPPGCAWAGGTDTAWVSVRAPATGIGNGALTVYVEPNFLPETRTATVSVGGQSVSVTQAAAACLYELTADTVNAPADRSTTRVRVFAARGCPLTVATTTPWLTATLVEQVTGQADVEIVVRDSSSTVERIGAVTVGSRVITVRQAADRRCIPELSTRLALLPAAASSTRIDVTGAGACGIPASSKDAWLTVAADASGATITAAANSGPTTRVGTVVIANRGVRVRQAPVASGCAAALPFTTAPVDAGITSLSVPVTAAAGCGWTASTTTPWLTVSAGANGSGNGTVVITLAAPLVTDTFSDRSGTVVIDGQQLTVRQGGPGYARRASVAVNGGVDNGSQPTYLSAVTGASGSVVAFQSNANLTNATLVAFPNLYVRDHAAGTTVLVSRNPDTGLSADQASSEPTISADGRFIAWRSRASNLATSATNGLDHVFLYDRASARIVYQAEGVNPTLSRDGRVLAFERAIFNSGHEVVVRDRDPDRNGVFDEPGDVDRVVGNGGLQAYTPMLSADGRHLVVIVGRYDDEPLTAARTPVAVIDLATDQLRFVSVSSAGQLAEVSSNSAAISANGRFVTFRSTARNLVRTIVGSEGAEHLYLHDRDADEDGIYDEPGAISTEQADVESAAAIGVNGRAWISADGDRLLYQASSNYEYRVRDRLSRRARRARVGAFQMTVPGAEDTGRFAAFVNLGAAWTIDLMEEIAPPSLEQAGPMLVLPDGSGRLPLMGRALEFPYVLLDGTPIHDIVNASDRSATVVVPPSRVGASSVTVRAWYGPESSPGDLTTVTCTYALAPSSISMTGVGGVATIAVTRNDSRCPIEVDASAAPWLSADLDGTTVTLDVDQHAGTTLRSATLHIAGLPLVVQQAPGVGGPSITSYTSRGGNAGDVSIRLFGRGFLSGLGIRLRRAGHSDIVARTVRVSPDGQATRGILDLRGQELGEWRIVLVQDGREYVTSRLFVVETPRPATFTCTIDAPNTMQVGVKTTFTVVCTNDGNMDAPPTTVVILPPVGDDVTISDPPLPPFFPTPPASARSGPETVDVRGTRLLPVVIPTAAPGEAVPVPVSVTPMKPGAFRIEAWTTEVELVPPSSADRLACVNSLASFTMNAISNVPDLVGLGGLGCGASAVAYFSGLIANLGAYAQEITEPGAPMTTRSWVKLANIAFTSGMDGALGGLLAECLGRSVPVVSTMAAAYEIALSTNDVLKDCMPLFLPPELRYRAVKSVTIVPLTNDSCRAYWSPYSQHMFGPDGGSRKVVLDVGAGCPWDLSRSGPPAWLHVTPLKGTGPAVITLAIDPFQEQCSGYCDRWHDFVADGLDGLNLGVKQLPRRISLTMKYGQTSLASLVARIFFPFSLGARAASARAAGALASGPVVTINGVAVPYEQEDENTLAIAIGGIPPGTPIRIDAVLADGREVHEVLPNLPSPATATTDTDADGMPDLWEIGYGLDPEASADAFRDDDGDGIVNRIEYEQGSHPHGTFARYLAEGASSTFFDMRIALANPGVLPANALVRFLDGAGVSRSHAMELAPRSRATLLPRNIPGLGTSEFSTVVESDRLVVVDRTMTWQGPGGYGAHAETGVPATSSTWYLAEGSTKAGFELFYLLQNPSSHEATARVRYLRAEGAPLDKVYTLPPNSRTNIWVNLEQFDGLGQALDEAEVSAVIDALDGTPLVVERAMYLSRAGRVFDAGHESAGVSEPAAQWFLAEGATGPYFDLFVLVANPNAQPADVEFTYLLPDGTTYRRVQEAPANSRSTVWVDYEQFSGVAGYPLADVAVSTTVRSVSGLPIIVERAMWWPGSFSTWAEAHNSAGSTRTGVEWVLADGEVGGPTNTETYVLMANTSAFEGQALVTLLFEDGTSTERTYALPPNSRVNAAIANDFGAEAAGRRFATVVTSLGATPAQIVVERAMYHDSGGVRWAAGSNAAATRVR